MEVHSSDASLELDVTFDLHDRADNRSARGRVAPLPEDLEMVLGASVYDHDCTRQWHAHSGFVGVAVTSRNAWYREEGRQELARIQGELRERALELLGREGYETWVRTRENMVAILDAGEFCPAHILAYKP